MKDPYSKNFPPQVSYYLQKNNRIARLERVKRQNSTKTKTVCNKTIPQDLVSLHPASWLGKLKLCGKLGCTSLLPSSVTLWKQLCIVFILH